ncbi:MAG: hypothetical protein ACE5I1_28525, partial [bacterium]
MASDFLNQERKKLAAALEKKILGDRARVSFAEINGLDLPEAILTSLQKQARTIFKTEKPIRIIQSDRFNFSDDKLKEELSGLRELLLEQVAFLPGEIKKSIYFSITLHFDLIVLPFRTIENILFQAETEKSSKESIEILNGIGENLPPVKAMTDRLLIFEKEAVSKTDIKSIAEKIKSEIYAENPVSSMLFDLDFLQKFYKQAYQSKESEYSAEVIETMLAERGMDDFVNAFQGEKKGKSYWNIAEIQQFLERHLLVGQLQQDDSFSSHIVYSDRIADQALHKKKKENQETLLESEIQVEERQTKDIGSNGEALENITEPQGRSFRSNKVYDGTDTDLIDKNQIEYQPPGPYPSLAEIIDNKSRTVFIKKIFSKDKLAYVEFIDIIEKKDSWKAAKAILDAELASR